MPYLATAQSYLEQSTLLISARPTTTKITTKYTISRTKPSPSHLKSTASSPPPKSEHSESQGPSQQSQAPKATLTLKTYDPVSGTCLKYKTDKAAEVGRLVASLGSCGRVMAALPAREETEVKEEPVEEMEGVAAVKPEDTKVPTSKAGAKGGQAQGKGGEKGGGGGKKKKGKK